MGFRFVVAALGLLSSFIAHGATRTYQAAPGEAQWLLANQSKLQCELTHDIPYYGVAKFDVAASKNKELVFNLDMVARPQNYGVAKLESVPPNWLPGKSSHALASMKLLRMFDGELNSHTAWLMLKELEKGYQPTFFYQDWHNKTDHVAVALTNVNFKNAYWQFLQCRDALLPYSFEDIAFAVMNYEKNSSELTKSSKTRLAQIGEYLKHDSSIESVTIAAYTDSYGGKWPNLELSKRRAKAIADYMQEMGVDQSKLVTEGFGEKRHIAPNDTPLERAKNRRVVIQLARE